MEPDRLEFFRGLLEERLQALLKDAGNAIGKLTDERENLPDAIDIASSETSRDFALRLQDRDRKLVQKIRHALKRIEDEEYGYCIACGEEITEKRLMARPVATHCIDCKTEMEQVQYHRRVF